MPNPRSGQMPNAGDGPKGKSGHKPTSMPMKTAAWPSVPGKTQPVDRNVMQGAPKLRQSPKEEGI